MLPHGHTQSYPHANTPSSAQYHRQQQQQPQPAPVVSPWGLASTLTGAPLFLQPHPPPLHLPAAPAFSHTNAAAADSGAGLFDAVLSALPFTAPPVPAAASSAAAAALSATERLGFAVSAATATANTAAAAAAAAAPATELFLSVFTECGSANLGNASAGAAADGAGANVTVSAGLATVGSDCERPRAGAAITLPQAQDSSSASSNRDNGAAMALYRQQQQQLYGVSGAPKSSRTRSAFCGFAFVPAPHPNPTQSQSHQQQQQQQQQQQLVAGVSGSAATASVLRHGATVFIAALGTPALLAVSNSNNSNNALTVISSLSGNVNPNTSVESSDAADIKSAAWTVVDPLQHLTASTPGGVVAHGHHSASHGHHSAPYGHSISAGAPVWLQHTASGLWLTVTAGPISALTGRPAPVATIAAIAPAALATDCAQWVLAPAATAATTPAGGSRARACVLTARPSPAPVTAADAARPLPPPLAASLLGPGAVSALTARGCLPALASPAAPAAASVLGALPPQQQEAVLCDDLLSALEGLPSRFIVAVPADSAASATASASAAAAGASNMITDTGLPVAAALGWDSLTAAAAATRLDLAPAAAAVLPPAFADTVSRVLPLCRDAAFAAAVTTAAAAGRPAGAGSVWTSLCSAIARWHRGHALLIARLEAALQAPRGLSLLQLWHATRPAAARWARVRWLLTAALSRGRRGRGAHLLTLVHRALLRAGDAAARDDWAALWAAAAAPYLALTAAWACHADLEGDAWDEFHIVSTADWGGDRVAQDLGEAYWHQRYAHRAPAAADTAAAGAALAAAAAEEDGGEDDAGPLSEVPLFLRPHAEMLLLAGRHWGVLRLHSSINDGGLTNSAGSGATALVPYLDADVSTSHGQSGSLHQIALSTLARNPRLVLEQPHILAAAIGAAHAAAATAALSLCRSPAPRGLDLAGRLASARGFFLLGYGDLASRFLDLAGAELALPAAAVSAAKLDALWEDAVRTTGAGKDPYRDQIVCYLQPTGAIAAAAAGAAVNSSAATGQQQQQQQQRQAAAAGSAGNALRGLDVLALTMRVDWPLNLVFSRRSLTKYQLLFRHLVFVRHVQRRLGAAFASLQTFKSASLERALAAANTLRHRMLHLVTSLSTYLAHTALEPAWQAMAARVAIASTVDEVVRLHSGFLDGALHACMLTHPRLLAVLVKVLTYCLLFADNARRLAASVDASPADAVLSQLQQGDGAGSGGATAGGAGTASGVLCGRARALKVAERTARASGVVSHPHFALMINKFSTSFDDRLRAFVALLAAETEAATAATATGSASSGGGNNAAVGDWSDLLTRLDFNGFYSTYFATNPASSPTD